MSKAKKLIEKLIQERISIGDDVYGSDFVIHVFRPSLRMEEFPPMNPNTGRPRIKGSRPRVFSVWSNLDWTEYPDYHNLLRDIEMNKHKGYDKVKSIIKGYADRSYAEHGIRGKIDYSEDTQRGVDAPLPPSMRLAPSDYTNKHKVKIEFDEREKKVHLADLPGWDDPRALTNRKVDYQKAIDTYDTWIEMNYRDILSYWVKIGISFHDWLAMD